MRESQRTSPMNFQFTMVQARAASADGLSSRCGLVRESDGNSPFGKFGRSPAAPSGGIVSATPISTHTYLESSVHLLWQKPTWPGAVTGRQPFPVQNRSKSEACGPSTPSRQERRSCRSTLKRLTGKARTVPRRSPLNLIPGKAEETRRCCLLSSAWRRVD